MSIECRKQKRKEKKPVVITPTNQSKGKYYKKPFKLKVQTMKLHKTRENADVHVAFGFEYIWLRKKRKFLDQFKAKSRKTKAFLVYFRQSTKNLFIAGFGR